jgi:mono/diheme cytochrome c family protein
VPRTTPPGTVPITGAEPDWRAEFKRGVTTTADRLRNPIGPQAMLEKGDTLYHVFCSVCHGPAGAGNGPVGLRMGAPSLLTDRARGFSDGYIYSYIRYGGLTIMPPYGDKIFRSTDRWAVVNYLRQLQGVTRAPDSIGRPAVLPSSRPQ